MNKAGTGKWSQTEQAIEARPPDSKEIFFYKKYYLKINKINSL